MRFPEIAREEVVEELIGTVLDHFDLFVDDLPLFFDVLGFETGMQDDIRKKIDRTWKMLVEHSRIEAGVFLRGEGVALSPD